MARVPHTDSGIRISIFENHYKQNTVQEKIATWRNYLNQEKSPIQNEWESESVFLGIRTESVFFEKNAILRNPGYGK